MAGKGDRYRPVNEARYRANWERIFGMRVYEQDGAVIFDTDDERERDLLDRALRESEEAGYERGYDEGAAAAGVDDID